MKDRHDNEIIYLDNNMFLDLHFNRVSKNGLMLPLSPTQVRLLKRLVRNSGSPVSSSELVAYTWGKDNINRNKDLYVLVNKTRNKLGSSKYILSVHGFGYMLISKPQEARINS